MFMFMMALKTLVKKVTNNKSMISKKYTYSQAKKKALKTVMKKMKNEKRKNNSGVNCTRIPRS